MLSIRSLGLLNLNENFLCFKPEYDLRNCCLGERSVRGAINNEEGKRNWPNEVSAQMKARHKRHLVIPAV